MTDHTVSQSTQRLEGLEPDNLLAFLALMGLMRALAAADGTLHPRVAWGVDQPPLRPLLVLPCPMTPGDVTELAAQGVATLATSHAFQGRKDPDYSPRECRGLLEHAASTSSVNARAEADLLAALMTDAAVKDDKAETVAPTALCLLQGQGHQHFLQRLASVPDTPAPPPRGRGKQAVRLSPADCLEEALFQPWHRKDPTFSFRWDPEEAIRYALRAGDPTDSAYKPGTQHGANRLAAIGLGAITLAPQTRASRVRPAVIGGAHDGQGFSFAWPIWREPATLAAIRALLAHPGLREPNGLAHLGVEQVMVAQRISVGKFMNFAEARPLGEN